MAHLLVIDDEGDIRHLYAAELEDDGHSVATAGNRHEAIALLKEQNFDMVILDIQLDQESGLELLQEIAHEREKLPVILCTAYSCYKEDFSSWLADAYIVKSSDLNELKSEVRRILAQARN
ncbi:MAG: response regulator [Desulfuromonadales bacterium]|nr:response regulator [Desulfuromonadales bacterium]